MKAIVTVKLSRKQLGNRAHSPWNKKRGRCPLLQNWTCTDVTGSHHSYIEEGMDLEDIQTKAEAKYPHITRIEVLPART